MLSVFFLLQLKPLSLILILVVSYDFFLDKSFIYSEKEACFMSSWTRLSIINIYKLQDTKILT